jgi:hypothetical protein
MTPTEIEELEKRIRPDFYKIKNEYRPKIIKVLGKGRQRSHYQLHLLRRSRDPLWRQAFAEYNSANPDNQMHTGCSPCFAKILMWHKRQVNDNP